MEPDERSDRGKSEQRDSGGCEISELGGLQRSLVQGYHGSPASSRVMEAQHPGLQLGRGSLVQAMQAAMAGSNRIEGGSRALGAYRDYSGKERADQQMNAASVALVTVSRAVEETKAPPANREGRLRRFRRRNRPRIGILKWTAGAGESGCRPHALRGSFS